MNEPAIFVCNTDPWEEPPGELEATGVLEVLSVGQGDLKLSFDPGDEERAKTTIEGMLRDGYGIYVETARGLRRVKRFNPKKMAYVIVESPTNPMTASRGPEREVPVARSRAKAIGATAGG